MRWGLKPFWARDGAHARHHQRTRRIESLLSVLTQIRLPRGGFDIHRCCTC
jgi:hypothetical protein